MEDLDNNLVLQLESLNATQRLRLFRTYTLEEWRNAVTHTDPTILNGDNLEGNKLSPLLCACKDGNTTLVELLIHHPRVDVNVSTRTNVYTPLLIACRYGFLKIVQMLLEHPDIDVNKTDRTRVSPLMVACMNGRVAIARCLLGDPSINVNQSAPPLALVKPHLHMSFFMPARWLRGIPMTPLAIACYRAARVDTPSDPMIIAEMLLAQRKINSVDDGGRTLLSIIFGPDCMIDSTLHIVDKLCARPGIRMDIVRHHVGQKEYYAPALGSADRPRRVLIATFGAARAARHASCHPQQGSNVLQVLQRLPRGGLAEVMCQLAYH